MGANVTTAAPPVAARPQLRPARLEDWEHVHRLEARHALTPESYDDWSKLWLENPLWPRLGDRWPLGWLLEDSAGAVVGSLLNIPTLYHFQGRELVNAVGRGWAVDHAYRGYALWLLDEYYNQPGADLFVNNTVNELAESSHHGYATRIPVGDWQTVSFWITGYRGFARSVLQKHGAALPGLLALPAAAWLRVGDLFRAQRLPPPTPGITIEPLAEFDARFDSFWQQRLKQNPNVLLAARDARTLTWHYAASQRRGRLWIYSAARNGHLRAYCVLKRQDEDDGIRRMRLVDYQTLEAEADLLPDLLRAVLERCAAEGLYALDLLATGLPCLEAFDRYAPRRHRRRHWPFWFRAADPALAAALGRPEAWSPSSYDGDASLA